MKARTETVHLVRFDRRLWTGPAPSSFIVYAVDVGHLVLASKPVPEYEKTALFRERARAVVRNGEYQVEFPRRM